jgi:hypothetical protein
MRKRTIRKTLNKPEDKKKSVENFSGNPKMGIKSLSIIKKISKRKIRPISPPIGRYLKMFSFISTNLIFSIITTNKKRTAIAPTYTTKNTIAKKSNPKRIRSPEALQKTSIRNKTECTGFFERITIIPAKMHKVEKR